MQALVCSNRIGWRRNARKLLIFVTNSRYPSTAEGKVTVGYKSVRCELLFILLQLIGIRNDGLCHLSSETYTHTYIQDYPSISQINNKVKENFINTMFVVLPALLRDYQRLTNYIEGSKLFVLSQNPSNIIDGIKEQYNMISSIVQIKDNASRLLNIKYFSKCLDKNSEEIETNKCSNIKVS